MGLKPGGEVDVRTIAILTFCFLAMTSPCLAKDTPVSLAQSRIDSLATALRTNKIGRIEILRIPGNVETTMRITPDALGRGFHYKFVIRDLQSSSYHADLLAAMTSTTVQAAKDKGDLRWGIIFFNTKDVRVGAIYFDTFEDRGAVNEIPVSFKGDLSKWLNANFSSVMK